MSRRRVLVVGVGSIGERHVRCFQATGRAEVAIVEPDPARRAEVAGRYGLSGAFHDLDHAMANPPEAAVIATPAPSHVQIAIQLAKANVHPLIEKPLGTSLEGMEALRSAVALRGLKAGVAYVYRCHPVVTAWREAVASGRFGRVLQLTAISGQHFPTYRPAYRSIYYSDRATGGGALQDALTHLLNAGEWVAGPITRLVADSAHQALEGVSVEDTAHVLARHRTVLASYALNQYQAPNEATLTAVCEAGTVRAELHAARWRWMSQPGDDWRDEPLPAVDRDGPFIAQATMFLDAIEGRGPLACPLDEGLQTLRVNLAALASAETGEWRTIEPTNE